jgi:ribulose-phosphate 3-epimerase
VKVFYFCLNDYYPEFMNRLIAPSLLAADFTNLQHDIDMVNNSEADWFHLDIMDGVFVPNISFGMPVVKAVKKLARKPLDVHLMIVEPEKYLTMFRDSGAEILTVHLETCRHLHRTVEEIKLLGMKAGVCLNPHTPVDALEEIITYIDMVLIMSVNPGFGGQKFIGTSPDKIKKTRLLIEKYKSKALIEVDGGVDLSNAALLFEAGVNILVAGTAVFQSADPGKVIHDLKNAGLTADSSHTR